MVSHALHPHIQSCEATLDMVDISSHSTTCAHVDEQQHTTIQRLDKPQQSLYIIWYLSLWQASCRSLPSSYSFSRTEVSSIPSLSLSACFAHRKKKKKKILQNASHLEFLKNQSIHGTVGDSSFSAPL